MKDDAVALRHFAWRRHVMVRRSPLSDRYKPRAGGSDGQAPNARTESDAFWGPFGSVPRTAVERSGNAEETQTGPFGREHRTQRKGGERGMAGDRATIVIVASRLVLGAWTRRLHRILRLSHRILCCQMQVIIDGRRCRDPERCDRGPRRQRLCALPVIGGMTGVRRRRSGGEEASHCGKR